MINMKALTIITIVLACLLFIMCGLLVIGLLRQPPPKLDANLTDDYDFDVTIVAGEFDGDDESEELLDLDELMALYDYIEINDLTEDDIAEDDLEPLDNNLLPPINGISRDDDGIFIGSIIFDEPILLKGAYNVINVREEPDSESVRLTTIGRGQVVMAYEVVDGWYKLTVLPGLIDGFIRSDLLYEYDDNIEYYAETMRESFNFRGNILESTLVDIRTHIPDIEYYLIFATPDNFTGMTLYSRDVPILQLGTIEKLKQAQEIFVQDGYRIKLYDAYRPVSVSAILYDIVQDRTYIAPPGSSTHNRAAAVDITLIDADGNELEMPSPMHTFNETAHRNSSLMSQEAKENMDYLTSVMLQCGFTTISSEWWHFNDNESRRYPPMDILFRDFTFFTVEN